MKETPGEADLHPVGCAARLVSVTAADDAVWIVVRGVQWIRLEAIERTQPCLMARVAPFTVNEEQSGEVQRLEQVLRERVRAFAGTLPDSKRILQLVERMSALQLADAAIANLPCSVDDKARYTREENLIARLEYVLALFDRVA